MTITIAVVGGGYSGISIILNMARFVTQPTKIFLFEKAAQVALGAAYSTTNPAHLLNVRANNMSAYPDKPDHFVKWLEQDKIASQYLDKTKPTAQQFLPRCIYGRYLQSLWRDVLNSNELLQIEVYHEEIIDIAPKQNSWHVTTAQHHLFIADTVVLATGNPAPTLFAEHLQNKTDRVLNNPWQDNALQKIAQNDDVLIIGTGLTMVDMVMSLHAQQYHGKVTAIARRACLPQTHQQFEMQDLWSDARPFHLRTFIKLMRTKIETLKQQGHSWHSAVDALRPYTHEVWQSFSKEDQTRFLRHLVPYWDTHRHRIAEQVADVIKSYQKSEQLKVIAGRIRDIELINSDQLKVHYQPRGQHHEESIIVNWVVNCTGPNTNYAKNTSLLFASLMQQGLISADDLKLGLRTNSEGQLLDAKGMAVHGLYTLAALCKPLLWECIAVPDIRKQSFQIAKKISI